MQFLKNYSVSFVSLFKWPGQILVVSGLFRGQVIADTTALGGPGASPHSNGLS
jgi:hypothetical protein